MTSVGRKINALGGNLRMLTRNISFLNIRGWEKSQQSHLN